MSDGVLVPVSQLLGSAFKSKFLSRYCVPLFDSKNTGFDSAPASLAIPGDAILRPGQSAVAPRVAPTYPVYSTGRYRLKYLLTPQIAVHPDAFTRRVFRDGPFDIHNMWSDREFTHTIL